MAGVSTAWLMDGKRHVVLLEAGSKLGGNVRSIQIQSGGSRFVVDMGAQYFHPALYPTYLKLLGLLDLLQDIHSFTASITLEMTNEATPRFVSPMFPGRAWPLIAPWNWSGLQAFAIAFAAAKRREEQNADWDVTMESWLRTLDLSRQQWEGMILPWAASLFSGSIDRARGLSARAAMIFAAKALPENVTDPLLYYVLKPGMAEVLRRLIARCSTVDVVTDARVTDVRRTPQNEFIIYCGNGRTFHVDDLVFASSGPGTLDVIKNIPGTGPQQAALEHIEFNEARLALHTDAVYSPNRAYWSFFNGQTDGTYCEASMWLADVLADAPPQAGAKLWKSWIIHRTQSPQQVLALEQFRHMLPTPATLRAQRDLLALQGQGGFWFAGGFTRPYDSQETALVSAIDVSQRLLAFSG